MDKFEVETFEKERVDGRPPAGDLDVADPPERPFRPSGADVEQDLPARPYEARDKSAPDARPEGPSWVPGEWVPPQRVSSPMVAAPDAPAASGPNADALRTRLAKKFIDLADSVTEAFRDFAIGGAAWAVELTAPEGMSTGGGKQALQHVRLKPRRPGYSVLVAGTVNQVERRAELRDFDHVAILHEVRFRRTLEISPQEWEQFLRRAEAVLNASGIQSMRTPPPRELLDQRRSVQRISRGAIAALVVVLLLAAFVVWRVVLAVQAP